MSTWEEADTHHGGTYGHGTAYQFAETDDPRILAVIEREDDRMVSDALDGDVFGAIYYREYRAGERSYSHQAGDVEDDIANAYRRASDELSGMRIDHKTGRYYMVPNWDADKTIARYMRIFHDTAYICGITGGYDRDGDWIIFDTPDWRKKCGIEGGPNVENISTVRDELVKVLDGDIWGVGYALNERRLTPDDEPIDLHDGTWDIQIECWGFIGEEYAQEEAAAFSYGSPKLPTLNQWLKFKLWLGDKLIDWGSRSNVLGRWGKTILKGLTA